MQDNSGYNPCEKSDLNVTRYMCIQLDVRGV